MVQARPRHDDDAPSEGAYLVLSSEIVLLVGPSRVMTLAVSLDGDLDLWVGEVDARDEARAVTYLVLAHGSRQPFVPERAQEPRLQLTL